MLGPTLTKCIRRKLYLTSRTKFTVPLYNFVLPKHYQQLSTYEISSVVFVQILLSHVLRLDGLFLISLF